MLIFLVTLGQLAVDLYTPSMPQMVVNLSTSPNVIQLTIALYLLSYGISQLFYGPLSDYFGRKPILNVGLPIFLLSSLGCALANQANLLVLFRICQGLGIGAAIILTRAILRDVFHGKQFAKVSATVLLFSMITPVAAPALGGYIQDFFGWRANFIAMFLYAGGAWAVIFFLLPETKSEKLPHRFQVRRIIKNYYKIIQNPTFLSFSFMSGLCFSLFISYATTIPFILQNRLGLTSVEFGWSFLFIASGTAWGSWICKKTLHHFPLVNIIFSGTVLMIVASLIMVLLAFFGVFNVLAVILPPFFASIGGGLVFPNCTTGALTPFRALAGTAGAALGCVQMGVTFLASLVASHLSLQTALALSIDLLCLSILIFTLFITFVHRQFEEEI